MKVLYFAWIREKIGMDAEAVTPPKSVATVSDLADWLAAKGDSYRDALQDRARIRAAVNQTFAGWDHPINLGDEVAFFPPVTGG